MYRSSLLPPRALVFVLALVGNLGLHVVHGWSQDKPASNSQPALVTPPVEVPLATNTVTESRSISVASWIQQFQADTKTLQQRFRIPLDPASQEYRTKLLADWAARLDSINFEALDPDNRIDWLLLRSEIEHERHLMDRRKRENEAARPLIPYLPLLLKYCASKEHGLPLNADEAASLLDEIATLSEQETQKIRSPKKDASGQATDKRLTPDTANKPSRLATGTVNSSGPASASVVPNTTSEQMATTAIQASTLLDQFSRLMQDTHRYHEGYDPKYTWWAAKPFESAKQGIANHRKAIREKLAGIDENDRDKIVGLPIGNDAIVQELKHAWLPYTPEELIAIGERELKWCDDRFAEAAKELGVEGGWKKALEVVKSLHVEPGDQPKLIRELAWEAVRFLEAHDLLTIPELAKQGWRVEMMSPDAQRVNPYFLGGDNIIVSFPTNTMTHSEKLMSLKSNNIHFCRATVHHELIPGHHLQYYALARFRPYREIFSSPFWMEGWALYWEMLLWDLGFAQSAEDKVGMLFWRRHRAARIIFSLNYQTGKWTAEQCVQYLIDRVGHEPSAAAAEVRRSVMGGYGPLYQAGYMLGGLQLRSLHQEIVGGGKMTNREFHDAVLQENYIPFELLRAKLLSLPLSKNQSSQWRFYDRP
jgi:uncharacterized protein (DUF885 family)